MYCASSTMFFSSQILIFFGVLVASVLLKKWMKKKTGSVYRYPPAIPSLPVVGSLHILLVKDINDISLFFLKKARELGPIFTLRFGNKLVVTLNNRDMIEKAYIKNASTFTDKSPLFTEALTNPENKGIIHVYKATVWKKHQQLSLSILKEFGFGFKSIMEMRISAEIECMTEFAKDMKGKSFGPKEMCTLATSNIMTNILFGRRREYELGLSELSIRAHESITDIAFIYDMLPFIRFLPSSRRYFKTVVEDSKVLFQCIEAEINQSLQNPDEPCFVQSYVLKAGPDYDRTQLNYLLRDLVVAGTDTTSTTIQWAFVALANNPDVQKRLHDEIDSVLTQDRLPTLQDEAKLPYVQATILELTRWRTLAPLGSPRATPLPSVVDGYFIPAGAMVIANVYAVHNDINLWKDPEVFRPERFLDSENNLTGKEKIIPFLLGRRSCLGETLARAELFLILTSLVKHFLVLPPEGQGKVNEDPKMPVQSMLYPTPFEIRLKERK